MAALLIDWNNLPIYPENGKGPLATSSVQLSYYTGVTVSSEQVSLLGYIHMGEPSVLWSNLVTQGFTVFADRGTYLQGESEQERNQSFP